MRLSEGPVVTQELPSQVETSADKVSTASPGRDAPLQAFHQRWETLIAQQLASWERDPGQLEDEGVEAPSPSLVRFAIQLARRLDREGAPPPVRVVPDPNGGIVFEFRQGEYDENLYIWEDGSVEYMRFLGNKLIDRMKLV